MWVYGLGYLGATTSARIRSLAESFRPPEGAFVILALHALVGSGFVLDAAGVSTKELEPLRDRVQYLALGHRHGRSELDGWIYSPGSLECWDLGEAEDTKGFYYVEVDGAGADKGRPAWKTNVQHLSSRRRDAYRQVIDLTGAPEPEAAHQTVLAALDRPRLGGMKRPLMQLILRGEPAFAANYLDSDVLGDKVQAEFAPLVLDIVNELNLPVTEAPGGAGGLSGREIIERQVLAGFVAEHPALKPVGERVVDLILGVRDLALTGAPGTDVIDAVETSLDRCGLLDPVDPGAAPEEPSGSEVA